MITSRINSTKIAEVDVKPKPPTADMYVTPPQMKLLLFYVSVEIKFVRMIWVERLFMMCTCYIGVPPTK
jgi:uncharacterized membrane protein